VWIRILFSVLVLFSLFTSLIQGTLYNLTVLGTPANTGQTTTFQLDVRTACGCLSTELTGEPSDFTAYQYLGKIYFSFVDESYCEQGNGEK